MKAKELLIIVFSVLISVGISAQENQNEYKTIFNKKEDQKVDHGGYGSFGVGYTQIDGKNAMQLSFKGAWVIDHHIALGLAGYSFFNNLDKEAANTNDYFLAGGYGGFYFEPIIFPQSSVHLSFPIFIGGGGVSTIPNDYNDWNYSYKYDYDIFFVFEPAVEIEFNVVKFFRLAVGTSYRLTNGVILSYPYGNEVSANALDGFNFYMIFKFGKF